MRVALYSRVSTDEQKQGGTIESQIKELENFAASRGHTVVEKYVDEGWSGSLLSRPALDALRDAAEQRVFEAVLINDVDRLSRDIANLAVVKRDLERKGVEVIFRKLPTEKGPLSDFMVNILGSFAEFERAMITDRTRRGRRYKVQERKLIIGNKPPYGYNYVKKDRDHGIEGHYEIHPEEARIVRTMYEWVANEGLSDRAVVRRLRELAVPARHGPWAWSSVHRVLTNETYVGITYYNKLEVVDGQQPSTRKRKNRYKTTVRRLRSRDQWIPIPLPSHVHIIERDLFDRVQSQRRLNRVFSPRNVKHFYLLRRVRKICGRCGWAYVGNPCHGHTYYRCGSRAMKPPGCGARDVPAKVIEALVWQAVEKAIQNPDLIIKQVRKLQESQVAEQTSAQVEVEQLQRELATLDQEEDRILAAYRTSVTSLRQFEKEIGGINERRFACEALLAKAKINAPPIRNETDLVRDITSWSTVTRRRLPALTDEQRQELLGSLLTEIVIHQDHIRLRGIIPGILEFPSQIVPTPSERHGHNPTSYSFGFLLILPSRTRVNSAVGGGGIHR